MDTTIETVERGPRRIARRARVAASPEEIFALLADPHRHHEVDGSGMVRPDVIGPRDLRLGDRFTVGMRMGPLPYRMTSTVTALEPNRLIEWHPSPGHAWRWELEPQADSSTQVTEIFDYTDSRLAAVFERVGTPAHNARGITRSLENLQRRFAR